MANQESNRQFQLPATFSVLVSRKGSEQVIAHALDCDVVCESNSVEAALEKLSIAVKTYVQFGIRKGWIDEIRHPAPAEFWASAAEANPLPGPPLRIVIDNGSILCHPRLNESRKVA